LKKNELEVVKKYGNFLNSNLLKAGHHGSLTSSSEEFLNSVKPKYIIIQVGEGNRYHHPHPSIINRYRKHNIKYLRTDEHGDIIIESDGRIIKVITKTFNDIFSFYFYKGDKKYG